MERESKLPRLEFLVDNINYLIFNVAFPKTVALYINLLGAIKFGMPLFFNDK